MNNLKENVELTGRGLKYCNVFIQWGLLAILTGIISGGVGTAFHISVEIAAEIREAHGWIIWLLPIGGICIAGIYHIFHIENTGTDQILESVREGQNIPKALAPVIFVSTVITHLLGGSAGREGAALQLGGTIGGQIGTIFKLGEKDLNLIIVCGMSGMFAALFGTPLTATIFATEVVSIGRVYYAGLVPCIISALTAYKISLFFGVEPVHYVLEGIPELSLVMILRVIGLAALCGGLSIIFCQLLHKGGAWGSKKIPNPYIKAAIGGFIIIGLTYLVGSRDYNGAGMNIIAKAIAGEALPYAFILKLIFTVVTISSGYKGGEIVPTFFIGSTFGCIVGQLIGLGGNFGAAIGLTALFCGAVNCPLASIVLSIELFGAEGMLFFAIACGVSYMLSGYYGLYHGQRILYSKIHAKYINILTK